MSNSTTQKTIKTDLLGKILDPTTAAPVSGSEVIRQVQHHAATELAKHGFPSVKHEEWKYTNLNTLLKTPFDFTVDAQLTKDNIQTHIIDKEAYNLIFVNGRYDETLSDTVSRAGKVTAFNIINAPEGEEKTHFEKYYSASEKYDQNPFSAANTAQATGGIYIRVHEGTEVDQPIYLHFFTDSRTNNIFTQPRNLIIAEPNSRFTIIENYINIGEKTALTNTFTEIALEKHATVNYYKIQAETGDASQVGTTQITQYAQSIFSSVTISLSGNLIRNNIDIVLLAEHSEAHLDGLYKIGSTTHVDNHTMVDHAVPNCQSNELYKGVLSGKATGVFNGKIIVRQDAQKTNAFQSNRNILLSDNAVVNTKPQLEIYADDVKCTHGAVTGRLDNEAIFYLRARGLSLEKAKNLLTEAFAGEIIEKITSEPLKSYVESIINRSSNDH